MNWSLPTLRAEPGWGGPHMLRHTGMCRTNGLLFHQKSLDMGPILVKKSLEEGPILQKLQKNCKISCFWGWKPLRIEPRFAKISKKQSSAIVGETSLDMGKGFRPWVTHPIKK